MATVREMMMQDAAASIETSYEMIVGDTFEGNLSDPSDADWVAVELEAGTTYQIDLSGRGMGMAMAEDTVLMLRDSKGGIIDTNDDINSVGSDDNPANLNSRLMFTAEEGGTYYIAASSYNRIPGDDNSGDYTVSVEALDLPADIEGTEASEKLTGTDGAEKIAGEGGNDTLDGMGGDDELDGGPGNDLITGGPGADIIKGGDGMDTISYTYSMEGVNINLRAGTASGGDAEGDDLGTDIENVQGSMHDDMLSGSRKGNMLWGNGGNDTLFGDKGNDTLFGGMGDDNLDGGDGEDTLEGGPGADELTGGEDDDTASFSSSVMAVSVRLHSSQIKGGDAEGDTWGDVVTVEYVLPDEDGMDVEYEETVPDIVNLTGSANPDILAGDSRDNTIKGGGGDDKIYGGPGGGNDILMGDGGADTVFGGHGDDELHGGAGDDMLHGGPGVDSYYGGAGSDMIYAEQTDAIFNGWLPAYDPTDPGNPNNAPANDEDTPDDDEGTEAVSDPMAVDTVSFARLEEEVEFSLADDAENIENLIGTPEDDTLTGDDQNNVIEGGDGADNLDGGDGMDTVSYENSDRRVSIDLSGDDDSASGGHAQGDELTAGSFENVTGSAHNDILVGDGNANVLRGLAGEDDITGGNGGDTIEGGAGADELDGDNGRVLAQTLDLRAGDTLSYAGSSAAVLANLATHSYSGGDAEDDEIAVQRGDNAQEFDHDDDIETDALDVSSFENLTGSMHNDRLTGDYRTNTIMGGDGDDTISGGGDMDVLMGQKGDDNISGGDGGDHLIGGPGADRLDGGEMRGERDNMIPNPSYSPDAEADTDNARRMIPLVDGDYDWAVYRPAMAGVEVDLSNNRGTGGDAMGDRLIGIEVIWGSKHDDTFIASADEDTHDIIHGDSGSDTVSYEASEEGVTVNLATDNATGDAETVSGDGTTESPFVFTYEPDDDMPTLDHVTNAPGVSSGNVATNGAFGDRLGGIQNLTGSNHKDTLTGDGDPNVLKGGGGNDTLVGAEGDDKLYGGAGRDSLSGDVGADTLNGGAGDDELTGGDGADTFVFGPGDGDDVINGFVVAEDMIDLTAFGLDADDLAGLLRVRGEELNARVIVDLRAVGGGTIELAGVNDIDLLDVGTGEDDNMLSGITDDATGVFII